MKAEEAIQIINEICERYTTVPTKRIKKLVRYIVQRNDQLLKDNKRIRNKNKKLKREIEELKGDEKA